MNRDNFFEQVNLALDERRDPIDDARVRSWLVEHPEDLETLERLRRILDGLAEPSRTRKRGIVRRVASILVLAAATLAIVLWVQGSHSEAPSDTPEAAAHIFHYRLSVETETPTRRTVRTATPSGRTVRSIDRTPDDTETDTRVVIFNSERIAP